MLLILTSITTPLRFVPPCLTYHRLTWLLCAAKVIYHHYLKQPWEIQMTPHILSHLPLTTELWIIHFKYFQEHWRLWNALWLNFEKSNFYCQNETVWNRMKQTLGYKLQYAFCINASISEFMLLWFLMPVRYLNTKLWLAAFCIQRNLS